MGAAVDTTEDGLDVSDELTFCLDSSEGFICDGGSVGVGGVLRELRTVFF